MRHMGTWAASKTKILITGFYVIYYDNLFYGGGKDTSPFLPQRIEQLELLYIIWKTLTEICFLNQIILEAVLCHIQVIKIISAIVL